MKIFNGRIITCVAGRYMLKNCRISLKMLPNPSFQMSFCFTNIGLVLITRTFKKINGICLLGQWSFIFQRKVVLNFKCFKYCTTFLLMPFMFLVDDFLKIIDGWPINGMIAVYFFSSFIYIYLSLCLRCVGLIPVLWNCGVKRWLDGFHEILLAVNVREILEWYWIKKECYAMKW